MAAVEPESSTEMPGSAEVDGGGGGPPPTLSDESMREESTRSAGSDGGGASGGGAGTETESQSESEEHVEGSDQDPPNPTISTGRADRTQAPVVKLSKGLIDTYNRINEVYYAKQKEKKKWDDTNSDYIIKEGDMVHNGQYRLKKVIGSGSFGQVVSAIDTKAPGCCDLCTLPGEPRGPGYPEHTVGRCEVAIKIIKNKPAFHRQAKIEIELLLLINRVKHLGPRTQIFLR